MTMRTLLLLLCTALCTTLFADDGSSLWLGYPDTARPVVVRMDPTSPTATADLVRSELQQHFRGDTVCCRIERSDTLGDEGFRLIARDGMVTLSAATPIGWLYGAYHLLRLQATGADCRHLSVTERPAYRLRLLNHWDNLDGSIERGYAGHSLWQWNELPEILSPRYAAYARANASVGINGTVLNNVNASPEMLRSDLLHKVAALADLFRPYGIRVYLSVNFASPAVLGGLPDSDPARPEVGQWWRDKAAEIYRLIPDFGGFLVKANSEGQPGPLDYGRTHADGANMLARALKPYGGIVMWRAFVYAANDPDRAKLAYDEFLPLDGQMDDNVLLQIKNGPIDFQPREPFSPLFGALSQTQEMIEFQITQEYLGQGNHLVFLAPLFRECLTAETGRGTVAQVTGADAHSGLTAIAGVANIGLDANWCGHDFAQANWYAFGRLAWRPTLASEQIADEWLLQTFTALTSEHRRALSEMMLQSREAVVDYMMPLGLHHLFANGHHYGPEPWFHDSTMRRDWQPPYYHQADSVGIGFDRTVATGSGATAQYASEIGARFESVEQCPESLLLWFHHLNWDYRLSDGATLWQNLCRCYQRGVNTVRRFQVAWDEIQPDIDSERFEAIRHKLILQAHDAEWWRDACLQYFQSLNGRSLPPDVERPVTSLEELRQIHLPMTHHN